MIADLDGAVRRPALYEPSDAPFWDDPYISARLLEAHLDDSHDAASRPQRVVERTVEHLVGAGLASPGTRVLDLGCGPGLYAHRLAQRGCSVTGIDLSASSLDYARGRARAAGLSIDYRLQDFLTLDEPGRFDLVLQAYGELSTFSDPVRDDLLARMRNALAAGGALVLDVSTPAAHPGDRPRHWELAHGGLWRPGPHLVLTAEHRYADDVMCAQHVVVDDAGNVVTYRMWFHDYTPKTFAPVLDAAGLRVQHVWGSLEGEAYHDGSAWLAVVARGIDLDDPMLVERPTQGG